jgi:hypothetical protein
LQIFDCLPVNAAAAHPFHWPNLTFEKEKHITPQGYVLHRFIFVAHL